MKRTDDVATRKVVYKTDSEECILMCQHDTQGRQWYSLHMSPKDSIAVVSHGLSKDELDDLIKMLIAGRDDPLNLSIPVDP